MRQGKVSESILKRSVLNEIRNKDASVLIGPGIGQDAAVVSSSDYTVVATTTYTMDTEYAAYYAVTRVAGDLACKGGRLSHVTCNLTFPTKFDEKRLKAIVRQLRDTLASYGASIVGGHTEISEAVISPILVVTGMGPAIHKDQLQTSKHHHQVQEGDEILLSKWLGMEGACLALAYEKEALWERFPKKFCEQVERYREYLSIQEEAEISLAHGAKYLHNLSAGGIFEGLWDLSVACNCGITVDMKSFPMKQEMIEICDYLGLNIYRIFSGGSLLCVASPTSGVKEALMESEIPIRVIGTITASNDKLIVNEDECRYLEVQNRDDFWSLLDGQKI
ncbi:MAG: hypothetical protein K6C69_03975 [Lachnospiraceae bacterium]|nr:hypothetical protein [Lachnospiraceae bacterium]